MTIAALDVHYTPTEAHVAAVVFDDWLSAEPRAQYTAVEAPVADYEPGRFYMRELSPLLKVIKAIDVHVETWVIDGYCHLSSEHTPGLGAYLHDALPEPAVIVGVAKNRFRRSNHACEVCRGTSERPLFVTAIGMAYDVAGRHVESMVGEYRTPALLKAVDRLCRDSAEGEASDQSVWGDLDESQ